jgi:hypothetical protein
MQRIGRRIASTAFVAAALLQPALAEPPKFQVDPSWPLPLPSNWIIGTIGGITVDAQDHIWINQRPSSLDAREKRASTASNVKCCVPAPPVIEFDQAGKVVQGWGGDGPGYKWGNDGHGIHVDHNNFVWVGDNVDTGGHIFKFTRDGKFVMRIGQPGTPTGSNDTAHLGRPADMAVDRETNELFVADGYGNHRVIVFDAATGAYKLDQRPDRDDERADPKDETDKGLLASVRDAAENRRREIKQKDPPSALVAIVQSLDADRERRNPAHDRKCNEDDQQTQIVKGQANISRDQLVMGQRTVRQVQAQNDDGRQHTYRHGDRPKDDPEHNRKPELAPVRAPAEPEQEMKQAHVSLSWSSERLATRSVLLRCPGSSVAA